MKLQNGCICCTLRLDLLKEIKRLSDLKSFDYILIESTGIAEPMQVAETFELDPDTLTAAGDEVAALTSYAKLDTCVTVVDLSMMKRNISSIETIRAAYNEGTQDKEGDKHIGHLLIDQLEFANVIVLNKCDIVQDSDIQFAKTFISEINPGAQIICSTYSKVDPREILNTGLFSMEEARNSAGWLADLQNPTSKSESDEYGVLSFIYTARRPFHPERLDNWLRRYFILSDEVADPSVLSVGQGDLDHISSLQQLADERSCDMEKSLGWIARSKGFVWIATRGDVIVEWNHGGRLLELSPSIEWFADKPESDWGLPDESVAKVKGDFAGRFGDKRQELVFIGIRMNQEAIISSLNECLLSEDEFKGRQASWSRLHDPLPPWPIREGMWMQAVSAGKMATIDIPATMELEISHLSLEPSNPLVSVMCQIFVGNKFRESLFCTLRSGTCDHEHTKLLLHGPHQVRVVAYPPQESAVVHLFGNATIAFEDEEEHDHEESK